MEVDLVLTGHDHTYARSGLIGEENTGGGAALMEFGGTVYCVSVSGPKFYELNEQEWMVSSAEKKQLFQVIRVDGDRMRYEAYTATGELHDLFELRKQPSGGNRLVERAELEAEAAPWWGANRRWALPALGALGLLGLLGLVRVVRRR